MLPSTIEPQITNSNGQDWRTFLVTNYFIVAAPCGFPYTSSRNHSATNGRHAGGDTGGGLLTYHLPVILVFNILIMGSGCTDGAVHFK